MLVLKTIPGQDQRVYNKPEVSQVAAVWVDGENSGEQGARNIEVKTHSNESRSVEYYYGCYDPLQYPLMFPYGELGWHQHIPKQTIVQRRSSTTNTCPATKLLSASQFVNADELLDMEETVLGNNLQTSKCVSVREYYAYKLQLHVEDKSFLLLFGRLLQQYVVDSYVKLETQRLAFYRLQQNELRHEFLQGVVDAMANGETNASAIGRRIVLPANFIGGPRNMKRKYIDAMALVQKFDKFAQHLNLTYTEFPDHFVWRANEKIWLPRQKNDSIGRIVVAHPSEGERYYLRMLLSKIKCPKSYDDLKVCNGVQVATFRDSALLHGYLIDDNSQELCLEEASSFHMPYELRRLFATLLVYTTPNNPRQLWVKFEEAMLEDFNFQRNIIDN